MTKKLKEIISSMGKPVTLVTFTFVSVYDKKRTFTRRFLASNKPCIEDSIERINAIKDENTKIVTKEDFFNKKATHLSLASGKRFTSDSDTNINLENPKVNNHQPENESDSIIPDSFALTLQPETDFLFYDLI